MTMAYVRSIYAENKDALRDLRLAVRLSEVKKRTNDEDAELKLALERLGYFSGTQCVEILLLGRRSGLLF
jgi:hypothetical protein